MSLVHRWFCGALLSVGAGGCKLSVQQSMKAEVGELVREIVTGTSADWLHKKSASAGSKAAASLWRIGGGNNNFGPNILDFRAAVIKISHFWVIIYFNGIISNRFG